MIACHNGQPTLMIRIASARLSLISNASAHAGLIRISRAPDGQKLRQIYELPLIRSRVPLLTLIWTVMHAIDKASPLFGYDAARLIEDDVHLWISVEGHDVVLATTIFDTQAYGPAEILYGMRYVGAISADAEGHPTADLRELSQIEPDAGPEPLQSGWVDARYACRRRRFRGADLARSPTASTTREPRGRLTLWRYVRVPVRATTASRH